RKETLGLSGRLKPLHAPLPLACGLVRVLCAVIQIAMLAMFHPREHLPLGSTVALRFGARSREYLATPPGVIRLWSPTGRGVRPGTAARRRSSAGLGAAAFHATAAR